MSIKDLINKAASEAGSAVERARRAEAVVDKQIGRVTKLSDMAVGHIEHATKAVVSANATLNRVLPLLDGDVIQRGIGMLSSAAGKLVDSKLATVKQAAVKLEGAVGELRQKVTALAGAGSKAEAAPAVSSLALKAESGAVAPAAAGASPHLLVLSADDGTRYHFGLSAAAFNSLRRQTSFNIFSSPRLQRSDALQAVGRGGETLSLAGVVYAALKQGGRELEKLRAIGYKMAPLLLTTGYGDVLGRWYMVSLSEDQDGLLADGAARKQTFTLEFKRYGDDYQNL